MIYNIFNQHQCYISYEKHYFFSDFIYYNIC